MATKLQLSFRIKKNYSASLGAMYECSDQTDGRREAPAGPTGLPAIQERNFVGLLATKKIKIYFLWPRGRSGKPKVKFSNKVPTHAITLSRGA